MALLNLNKPNKGDKDWHTPLNANFTDINYEVNKLGIAVNFAPFEQNPRSMKINLEKGYVYDGDSLLQVGKQSTGSITAPSNDDRIDRVVLDAVDASVSVITGTEASSPSPPDVPADKFPCAQIYLTPSTSEIADSDITDERAALPNGIKVTAAQINKLDGVGTVADFPEVLHKPTGSSDPNLGFGTWRIPNANRPTFLMVRGRAWTDGASSGRIDLDMNESGASTQEYKMNIFANKNLGSGLYVIGDMTIIIPPGGSYRIENANDPSGNNKIYDIREFTL